MSSFGGKADITDKPHVIDGDTIEILKIVSVVKNAIFQPK